MNPSIECTSKSEAFVVDESVLVVQKGMATQSIHAHRSFEFIIAIDGPVDCVLENGNMLRTEALVIPPSIPHFLNEYRGRMLRVYFDPYLYKIADIRQAYIEMRLDQKLSVHILDFVNSDRSHRGAKYLISQLHSALMSVIDNSSFLDPRVCLALNILDSNAFPSGDRYSLAERVRLSPSRFAAIFAAETRMSLRRYVRWKRLLVAAHLIREGAYSVEAAFEAGFSDQAHFSRVYRATFGSSPSDLQMIKIVKPLQKQSLREAHT